MDSKCFVDLGFKEKDYEEYLTEQGIKEKDQVINLEKEREEDSYLKGAECAMKGFVDLCERNGKKPKRFVDI